MFNTMRYREDYFVPWSPLVFFIPFFFRYGVLVDDNDLIFGYGCTEPNPMLTAKRIPLKDIEKTKITTGDATWKDNLLGFGGWGIRLGSVHGKTGWAYNPTNGGFVELELKNGSAYRFNSVDPQKLKEVLSRD